MQHSISSISVVAPPGSTVEHREDAVIVTMPGHWPRWGERDPGGPFTPEPRNRHERRRRAALARARAA